MQIYTDGHLDGLNGIGGVFANSGYSLLKIKEKVITIPYTKNSLTNNEAEMLAIFHALTLAKKNDIICSDSQIAIGLSNNGKSNEPRLYLIAIANKYLINKKKIKLQWIAREYNPVT